MTGNDKKNTTFRDDLAEAIEDNLDHPFFNGIHMQAHHIISAKGLKDSGLGGKVKVAGYDINHVKNLVFLPSTLPGACHLGVQPHRGDHKVGIDMAELNFERDIDEDQEEKNREDYRESVYNDDDDDHADDYHDFISIRLKKLNSDVFECEGKPSQYSKSIIELNKLSRRTLKKINNFTIPLSEIGSYFKKGSEYGCGNCINIKEFPEATVCKSDRDHTGETHPMYRSGKYPMEISLCKPVGEKDFGYKLKVGN